MLSIKGITSQIAFGKRDYGEIKNPKKPTISDNLYYRAKDGSEISLDDPKAFKILEQKNRDFLRMKNPQKTPNHFDLYYIAKDGTEIPVDSPNAIKMLERINKEFWEKIKIKKPRSFEELKALKKIKF